MSSQLMPKTQLHNKFNSITSLRINIKTYEIFTYSRYYNTFKNREIVCKLLLVCISAPNFVLKKWFLGLWLWWAYISCVHTTNHAYACLMHSWVRIKWTCIYTTNQNTHIYFMHAYSPLFKNKHSLHFKLNDTLATKCLMIKIKMMWWR